MEFDLDVKHGIQGHVEITDYSKEYNQYYDEDAEIISRTDKFKYSQSASINVIIKVDSSKATLLDVVLDDHTSVDKEVLAFDVRKDGYYTVTHFVLPKESWLMEQVEITNTLIPNYSCIYYLDNENQIVKRIVTSEITDEGQMIYYLSDPEEVTIREMIERNLEGTTLQKCVIDVFYTGFLQECYINYCRAMFKKLMEHCRPKCTPNDASSDQFARDFLWMTLNIIDYLVTHNQYLEAQRILEEIDYCGGFCNNVSREHGVSCGCSSRPKGCGCGQS